MLVTAFNKDLVAIFDRMQLEILEAPSDSVFITGDQPIVLFDPTPLTVLRPGTGLTHSEVEITFPLSARKLLRFSWKNASGERLATAVEVAEWNRRTVVMAKRYVFASDCNEGILELVRRNHTYTSGTELRTIPLPNGSTLAQQCNIPVRPIESYRE
jgi:hypothetical protein